jgi:hypothetical protein
VIAGEGDGSGERYGPGHSILLPVDGQSTCPQSSPISRPIVHDVLATQRKIRSAPPEHDADEIFLPYPDLSR